MTKVVSFFHSSVRGSRQRVSFSPQNKKTAGVQESQTGRFSVSKSQNFPQGKREARAQDKKPEVGAESAGGKQIFQHFL